MTCWGRWEDLVGDLFGEMGRGGGGLVGDMLGEMGGFGR